SGRRRTAFATALRRCPMWRAFWLSSVRSRPIWSPDDSQPHASASRARHAPDVAGRSDTRGGQTDAIVAEGPQSRRARHGAHPRAAAAPWQCGANVIVHHEQLVDPGAAVVAGAAARCAAGAVPGGLHVRCCIPEALAPAI